MLVAETSLGLTFATNLFVNHEPAKAGNSVTIFDSPGQPPDLAYNVEEVYKRPSVQIRVRNTSSTTGWSLANDIATALHGRANETWNGTYYTLIKAMSNPILLDWDENKRSRFIINFDIQRR
jgi:hypothetical protein